MARKKAGLGRGLDALLSSTHRNGKSSAGEPELSMLPVEKIQRGQYQPRIHIRQESLEELAESIRTQGLVQPIVVRPVAAGYELIAGERRWRASQMAGLHEIPAIIRDVPDQAAAAMALIENIQRENLNPLEESQALQRLIDEFGLTHQQTADSVGRSRTAVTNLLRLLDLEEGVKELLDQGELEMGHARALLAIGGAEQLTVARFVVSRGLSVRETERHIRKIKDNVGENKPKPRSNNRSPDVIRLESDLSDKLGAPVKIQYNSKGQGKITVAYNNLDELDGILEHIS
ncbi:MAG TPA: ParB/RepB/Spo0J family partition protein [Gammaproteobacteria bacterium]|nr:ParB/RepB/Spo0J family partition protein [Gammaproteobacteria bacterium]